MEADAPASPRCHCRSAPPSRVAPRLRGPNELPMRRPSSVEPRASPGRRVAAIGPREVQLATLGQEQRRESQYRDRDHGQRLEGDLDHRSAASAGHMSRVQSARGAASPHPRPSTDGAAGHGSARPSPERRRFRGARRADARRLCRGNAHAERTYDRLGFREIAPRRLDARSTISRSHEGRMAPQGDPSMSLRPRLARALQPCLCWLPAASRRHRRARQGIGQTIGRG